MHFVNMLRCGGETASAFCSLSLFIDQYGVTCGPRTDRGVVPDATKCRQVVDSQDPRASAHAKAPSLHAPQPQPARSQIARTNPKRSSRVKTIDALSPALDQLPYPTPGFHQSARSVKTGRRRCAHYIIVSLKCARRVSESMGQKVAVEDQSENAR